MGHKKFIKMNAKRTSIRVVLLLIAAIMAVSCGQKTKGPASLSVASENKEAYIDGFKHYFKLSLKKIS